MEKPKGRPPRTPEQMLAPQEKGKSGRPSKIFSEQQIRGFMAKTRSNAAAARFAGVTPKIYKKYASLYKDEKSGKNLWDLHSESKARVKKFYAKGIGGVRISGGRDHLQKILNGEVIHIERYDVNVFKRALISNLFFEEKCNRCGYNEKRIYDLTVPLLMHFKNGSKKCWIYENIEFVCHNCYYLYIDDVYKGRTIKDQEIFVESRQPDETWELPAHMKEHLRELGLLEEEDKSQDDKNNYITYKE